MGPLATVTDLAAILHESLADDDAAAILALNIGSDGVRAYCGQTFTLVNDETITLRGNGKCALLLPQLPTVSVAEVIVDDGTPLVEGIDYGVNWAASVLERTDDLWTRGATVSVTYTHGYRTPAMPGTVKGVVLAVAVRIYRNLGVSQEGVGNNSYAASYRESGVELSAAERSALGPYRHRRLA